MTKEYAIALAGSNWWAGLSAHDIVTVQLFEEKLCMDFSAFHKALEEALKRPVYTHEFAFPDDLRKEFLGDKPAPTWDEIVGLIPAAIRMHIAVSP